MFKTLGTRTARALGGLALFSSLGALPAAQAGVDSVVAFTQAGHVDIILTSNAGGFDHILEPVLVGGNAPFFAGVPSGGAWMVGTENGSTLSLIGDPMAPRSPTAFNTVWGYFDDVPAGQEISLRLTNVVSDRIGGTDRDTYGSIDSQLFTGSGAINNTMFSGGSVLAGTPGAPQAGGGLPGGYTYVTFVSDTQIDIGFSDLDPNRPDPYMNMTVTLLLTPVPEPAAGLLLMLGLASVGLLAGLRRGRA